MHVMRHFLNSTLLDIELMQRYIPSASLVGTLGMLHFCSTLQSQLFSTYFHPFTSVYPSNATLCHLATTAQPSTLQNVLLTIPPSPYPFQYTSQTMLWQPTRPTIVLLKKNNNNTETHLLLHSRTRDSNSVAHDTVATALSLIFVDLCGFFIVYPLVFIDFHWFADPNPSKTARAK